MTQDAQEGEIKALRAEVAMLRQTIAELALRHGDVALVVSEVLRRLERNTSLRADLGARYERGMGSKSLADLRRRVDQSVDELLEIGEKLMNSE